MRFLFTGGGTGGHVAPALAIAEALRERHPDAPFLYVGVAGKAEATMVPRAWAGELQDGRASLRFVRSRGWPGARSPRALAAFAVDLALGILRSLAILLRFRPQAIVATGGYVSAPVLLAAFLLRRLGRRIPIFVHEQNAVLGRMNALATRFADCVGIAFPGTPVPERRRAWVGYPVRAAIVAREADDTTRRQAARERLGLPQDARVVFAFGGSQGARTLNRAMVDALPFLLADPRVVVVHGTGQRLRGNAYDGARDTAARLEALRGTLPADWEARYRREPFFHEMGLLYDAADLVICRGGAGSVKEVAANGVPAVIIPKANLPGDHQAHNARAMERLGAARVVYERARLDAEDISEFVEGKVLADVVLPLLEDPSALERMGQAGKADYNPECTRIVADIVDALAAGAPVPPLPAPPAAAPDRILGQDSNALDHLLRRVCRGDAALSEEERRLVLYKVDGYLAERSFVPRCRGARMVGLGGFHERLDVLLSFAVGRDGRGHHRQVPLVRRDAFVGLGYLGDARHEVVETLVAGLRDPYFEARAAAAEALWRVATVAPDARRFASFMPLLVERMADRCFENRVAAIRAASAVTPTADAVLPAFRSRRFDPNWKVRVALLEALGHLVERGLLSSDEAQAERAEVLITSDGYRTEYELKEAYNRLGSACTRG